jgi:hypothetical protein
MSIVFESVKGGGYIGTCAAKHFFLSIYSISNKKAPTLIMERGKRVRLQERERERESGKGEIAKGSARQWNGRGEQRPFFFLSSSFLSSPSPSLSIYLTHVTFTLSLSLSLLSVCACVCEGEREGVSS